MCAIAFLNIHFFRAHLKGEFSISYHLPLYPATQIILTAGFDIHVHPDTLNKPPTKL